MIAFAVAEWLSAVNELEKSGIVNAKQTRGKLYDHLDFLSNKAEKWWMDLAVTRRKCGVKNEYYWCTDYWQSVRPRRSCSRSSISKPHAKTHPLLLLARTLTQLMPAASIAQDLSAVPFATIVDLLEVARRAHLIMKHGAIEVQPWF